MKATEATRNQWFATLDALNRSEELYREIKGAASSAAYAGGDDDPTGDQWCGKVADNVSHDVSETFKQAKKLSDGVRSLVEDRIDFGFAFGQFPEEETKMAILDVLDQAVRKERPTLNFKVGTLLTAEN